MILKEGDIYFYVFHAGMKDEIVCQYDGRGFVAVDISGGFLKKLELFYRQLIQRTFVVVVASTLYYVSVEDLATISYFLVL